MRGGASRVIVGSMAVTWLAGFARADNETGAVLDGFSRAVGVIVAGILLSFLAKPAPKVAKGLALVMAFTYAAGRATAIGDTFERINSGQAQRIGRKGREGK